MSELDELMDQLPEGRVLADAVDTHLDAHPFAVDDALVVDVTARVAARIRAKRRRRRWVPLGVVAVAVAASWAFIAIQSPVVDVPETTAGPSAMAMPLRPQRTTSGPLRFGLITLEASPDSVIWSHEEDGEIALFVEQGQLELPDGNVLTAGTWWVDGRTFHDGQPAPVPILRHVRLARLAHHLDTRGTPMLIPSLLAAMAATPDTVGEEVASSRQRLKACETGGCSDQERAIASFVQLVGHYVDGGERDEDLAQTVRRLDPDLHGTLPAVLQASLASPVAGAPDVGPSALAPIPPFRIPTQESERVEPQSTLVVTVTDVAGSLVPGAFFRTYDERERHRVNTVTGTWFGSEFYLEDGTQRAVRKDEVFHIEVGAPGYHLTRTTHVAGRRKKKNTFTLVLTPLSPPVDSRGERAWADHQAWGELEKVELLSSPALHEARDQAVLSARQWMAEDGGMAAEELCLVAGSYDTCGLVPPRPETTIVGLSSGVQQTVDEAVAAGVFASCSPREGWVQLRFVVGERLQRHPVGISIESSALGHTAGDACVVEALSRLTFPEQEGVSMVRMAIPAGGQR